MVGLPGNDLVSPIQLLQQDHPRELVRQRHRAQRELHVALAEAQAPGASDHEAEVHPGLPSLLEEAAERLGVEGPPLGGEEHREAAVGDALCDLLVLAHLHQLEPGVPGQELLVVLDVVCEGRPQPPHGQHQDPHAALVTGACDTKAVPEGESEERHFDIHADPEVMAGHYANFANVSHSDYEFTITFARVDHEVEEEAVPGVVVSRMNLSPRFMRELIDAMEDNFSKWQTREGIKNLPEFDDDNGDER